MERKDVLDERSHSKGTDGARARVPAATRAGPARRPWPLFFLALNAVGLAVVVARLNELRAAPGRLAVIEVWPRGEAGPRETDEVQVEFGAPLDPGTVKDDSLRLVPPVPGKVSLAGERKLALRLEEKLRTATRYRVVLSSELRGLRGELAPAEAFSFHTPPLRVTGVSQTGIEADGSVVVTLEFNEPVDPRELAEHLRLTSPRGGTLCFRPVGGGPAHSVRVRVPSVGWERMNVLVSRGLTGTAGPLPLEEAYRTTVKVSARLRFLSMTARHQGRRSVIEVRTNSRIDAAAARPFVEIEPPVEHTFDAYRWGLRIVGRFEPARRYRVTLKAGLFAGAAGALEEDIARSVWFPDRPPDLRFAFGGGYLSPHGLVRVPVRSVNVGRAELSVERLYETNVVEHALRSGCGMGSIPGALSASPFRTEFRTEGRRNEETETLLDLRRLVRNGVRGVYGLGLRGGDSRWWDDHAVVVVTDLGLSARVWERRALVWVTSISKAAPVEGVEISVYSARRQKLGTAPSGPDGLARVDLAQGPAGECPALVVASRGNELSYLTFQGNARQRGAGSADGRPYLARGYEVCAFAERGVYRPADTVRLSAFVRGGSWRTPEPMPLEVAVTKPDGRELVRKTVQSDAAGRLTAEFAVPHDAPTGRYRASYRLPGTEKSLGEASFMVAEYVPRTLRMRLSAPPGPLSAAEPLRVKVHVEHLFGEPARGLRLRCRARYAASEFTPRAWRGYSFGDARRTRSVSRVDFPETALDRNGCGEFSLSAPNVSTPAAIRLDVEVEVLEVGGRALAESLSRQLHGREYYLGVRPPEKEVAAGRVASFSLVAVSPDGSGRSLKRWRASLYRVSYNSVLRRQGDGRLGYARTRRETFVEAAEGTQNSLAVTAKHPGSHRLVVESEGACSVTYDFYVSGPGMNWEMADPDELLLTLDRRSYRPGETARLSIRTPFGGTALVCVESDRVLEHRVVELADLGGTEDFTVGEGWRPNVYLTAALVRPVGAEEEWRPHRASGVVRLDVDCTDRKLDVLIDAPERARPGRELALAVRVASGGKPRPGAAVVLAAVDEGALALTRYRTPRPWEFFYGARRLGVREFDMFSRLSPQLAAWKLAEEVEPGGGGGPRGDGAGGELARRLNAVRAKRVRTAVLYAGALATDEEGVARATFIVPDYVGELRVMAAAASGESFGSRELALPVKSPVMARASWPRFLAPGDEFELPVTLFNRTAAGGPVEVTLALEGPLEMRGRPPAREVPAGGEETIRLRLRATGVGKTSARLDASLGDETFTESVELPVRPAAAFARRAGTVTIEGGTERTLTVGGEFLPGTARCSVVIAGSPVVELTGALYYLLSYPHGCAEQTTSRLVPLIYLRDLAELAAPGAVGGEEIDEILRAGCLRLRMMQTHQGGLAMWPACPSPDLWASLYAADVLVEAEKAGLDVPRDLLEPLIGFASDRLGKCASARDSQGRPTMFGEAAYACYVLARARRPAHGWMARLEEIAREGDEKRNPLPASARFHLAAAYLASGELEASKEFVADARPSCTARELGGYLDSPVREAAIMLSVLLDVDPESAQLPALVERLRRGLRLGAWGTTQENAFALMALGKYARRMGPSPDAAVTVTLPDGSTRTFRAKDGLRVQDIAPGRSIGVKVEGEGKVQAFWHAEGVPLEGAVKEEDSGIAIRRRLLEADGLTPADPEALVQGRIYLVELFTRANRAADNLVITDLLPAGFEIEDANLAGSARIGAKESATRLTTLHVERRDDRLLVFCRVVGGTGVFRYAVRAVTPGTFVLPAAEVSCMYDPGLYSVHGRGRVVIGR